MANIYVRSTDGSDADSGATWALAKATLSGAGGIDAAGDNIYVSDAHAESTAVDVTISLAGTASNPVKVICGDDAAEPPTTATTTGTVTSTGTSDINVVGSAYIYGLSFNCGTGASTVNLVLKPGAGGKQTYENCVFSIPNTATTSRLAVCNTSGGTDTDSEVEWRNCDVSFGHASQNLQVNLGNFRWKGGSILAGSADLTYLINSSAASSGTRPGNFEIEAVDFSNMAAGFILAGTHTASFVGKFKNCKLPASWSGNLGTFSNPGPRIEMHNCDAGGTNYRMWVEDYYGSTKTETTIVMTGGASDGTTPISWKMESSSNATYPAGVLVSPVFSIWNDTTGVGKTVTVEFVHDTNIVAGQGAGTAFAFQDDEVWLEVEYLSASGSPLGTIIRDVKATPLTTAADQTSSSVAWTTTGMTTPVKQKLVSASFTPQQKGYIQCRVYVAAAGKIIYVDPKITVA